MASCKSNSTRFSIDVEPLLGEKFFKMCDICDDEYMEVEYDWYEGRIFSTTQLDFGLFQIKAQNA